MSFIEVQFPTDVSYGSKGGPGYSTNIVVTDGGTEERVARWTSAKRQYDVRYGIKSREQMFTVVNFYHGVQGAAYGFRFKDWIDYNTSNFGHQVPEGSGDNTTFSDQVIGTGDGTTVQFQLQKRYVLGGVTRIRTITKPVTGTVKIGISGVNQSSGWTVDTTSGIVTFSSPPANSTSITAGFEFDTPVRFGKDVDKVLMASVEDYGYGNLDPITLTEVPDGLNVNDDAYCGGAVEICLSTSNYQLSAGYARGYIFENQSSGLVVFLPDPTNLPTGGPYFWILNLGPNSITVKTYAGGATFVTLASGQGVTILLTVDGSGQKNWYAI